VEEEQEETLTSVSRREEWVTAKDKTVNHLLSFLACMQMGDGHGKAEEKEESLSDTCVPIMANVGATPLSGRCMPAH